MLAGAFTIALLIFAILVGMWLSRDRTEYMPYQIATKLSVPGLNPQAAVRYRGLDVGRVQEISFDPEVVGQILIHIHVRPDTPITRSTYAVLGYQGVTGIAYVQLNDDGSNPTLVKSSEEQIARIEMRPGLFDQLQNRGLAILEQTEEIARRVNNLLAPENEQAILQAFESVSRAATEFETIPRLLRPTLSRLPALADEAHQALASIDALSRQAKVVADNLNATALQLRSPEGPISKVGDAAERVGGAADRLEHETLPVANDVRSSLRALNRTLERLAERPQSILFGTPAPAPGPGEPGFETPVR